jgi:hypothetical protein
VSTVRYFAATLVLYTALAAVLTYPQFLHLSDTVHDDGDPLLNTWALAWVAHQLPFAPGHLFDGNIFYPERYTLAFSETLIVPAVIVAPLHWLGVGPLLVHNIVFLSGFIVSGAGVAVLVRSLLRERLESNTAASVESEAARSADWAGAIAGIVFGFLPYRIDHYPHLQLQQTQFLPFAFWAFHRLLRTGRLRDGVLFGLFTAGQVLSCMYYGLFLVPYMAAVCGTMVLIGRSWSRDRLVGLAVATAIAIVLAIPVGRAHAEARKIVGERSTEEVARGSARIVNYLGPPRENLLYGTALKAFADGERRLFPGFLAIALAAVALWPRRRTRRWSVPVLAYAIGLLLAFDLSLGFNGISYRVLYDYVLPFRGLRIPARMGIITGFSLAVLAGFGAHRLVRGRPIVALVIAGVMVLEYASWPLRLRQLPTQPPESYMDLLQDIGDAPTATIFEFPSSPHDDPTYMYFSTFHWQRLINGYSGFFPQSYARVERTMWTFPDQTSIDALKSRGARYLLVHGERMIGGRYGRAFDQLAQRSDVTLISRRPAVGPDGHKEISLYRISYDETAGR